MAEVWDVDGVGELVRVVVVEAILLLWSLGMRCGEVVVGGGIVANVWCFESWRVEGQKTSGRLFADTKVVSLFSCSINPTLIYQDTIEVVLPV